MTAAKTINLRTVKCCATCIQHGGWLDNMLCNYYAIETRPYWLCDEYDENKTTVSETVKVVFLNEPDEDNQGEKNGQRN